MNETKVFLESGAFPRARPSLVSPRAYRADALSSQAFVRPQAGGPPASGFTRLECLAVLSALAILTLLALPALANTRSRADRLVCFNNLRLLGRAEHLWANDHRDRMPWYTD